MNRYQYTIHNQRLVQKWQVSNERFITEHDNNIDKANAKEFG